MLELQNASKTIIHEYLLYTLEAHDVRGVCSEFWFTSYLSESEWSQCISINGKVSKPLLVDCSVPHGSLLGPLLFNIYVNDFPNSSKNIILSLFADDANCLREKKNETSSLQDEIEHISDWMAMNELNQNNRKTEPVHFSNWKDDNLVFQKTEMFCNE